MYTLYPSPCARLCARITQIKKRAVSIALALSVVLSVIAGVWICAPADEVSAAGRGVNNRFARFSTHGLYIVDDQVSQATAVFRPSSVTGAAAKFSLICDRLPEGANIYFALIPDKNYYLAGPNGYPSYDYDEFRSLLYGGLPDRMQIIDLFAVMGADDYYRTDTHWDQARLRPVVETLAEHMDLPAPAWNYVEHELPGFYGTYFGNAAFPVKGDTLTYLTSGAAVNDGPALTVEMVNEQTGELEPALIYDEADFENYNPYDVFLHGAKAVVRITNPHAATDRTLVMFRDSFGSALAPLLIEQYSEIVMVDFRFLNSTLLDRYVTVEPGDDVLFLYSTMMVASSGSLRIY